MPSLTQLFASHTRLLVLDAASKNVQVGLLHTHVEGSWRHAATDAGAGIFTLTHDLLGEAGLNLGDIEAFVFCAGPGSMLGTRTIAMAIRTWQVLANRPAYSYQSLAVAGHYAWTQRPRKFTVIADARRDTWHCQPVVDGAQVLPLERVAATALPAGELLMPADFRAWGLAPRPTTPCSYHLEMIFPSLANYDCFSRMESPDAFQHEVTAYKKWSAKVHSVLTADLK